MARQTRVTTVDDLDGSGGARTYEFSWQSTTYEIDLTGAYRDELLRVLEPYIGAARRTHSGGSAMRSAGGRGYLKGAPRLADTEAVL